MMEPRGAVAEEEVVQDDDGVVAMLPRALEGRAKIVRINDPPGWDVVVKRWSWLKFNALVRLILQSIESSDEDEDELLKGSNVQVAGRLLDVLGTKVFQVIRESVVPEQRSLITEEIDAQDVTELLDAILEVNGDLIDGLKKKLPKMLERFGYGPAEKAVKVRP